MRLKFGGFFWFLVIFLLAVGPLAASDNPFKTPPGLRPRVDFWIDVFTRYGEHQRVLHHREYPQIVFMVLDFREQAASLGPARLDAFKKARTQEATEEIEKALQRLASGQRPQNALEERIQSSMQGLGGGNNKYKRVATDKLIRSQTGIAEKYAEAIRRSGRYLYWMEQIFGEEFALPVELTRLPFIESSFDYYAYSSAGASGVWQFMPATARSYMRVDAIMDERRDVIASTRAAAKYLSSAYRQLGSWPLAITSYNHGVAGVKRRVAQYGTEDIVKIIEHPEQRLFGFASNNFYPEFLAAVEVYDNYQRYFPGIRPEPVSHFVEFPMLHSLSAAETAARLRLSTDTLYQYNRALSRAVWQGRYRIPKGYRLKVPPETRERVSALRAAEPVGASASSVYGGVVYTVRRGDNLSTIARRYNTTVAELRRLNNLRGDVVRVGQVLTVRESEGARADPALVLKEDVPLAYKVKGGDTLSSISRRYGVPVATIRSLNNLSSDTIRIGQSLRLSGSSSRAATTGSRTHTVKRGESLWSISRAYGVSVAQLQRANKLRGSKVIIGQRLRIP